MSASAMPSRLSVKDYLAGEEVSNIRHEYIVGETYAMTGASRVHGLIALNLGAFLRPLLCGGDCQAFIRGRCADHLLCRADMAETMIEAVLTNVRVRIGPMISRARFD